MTIASAEAKRTHAFYINDLNKPLVDLWNEIINRPEQLAEQYEKLWTEQLSDPKSFYVEVRDKFNRTGAPQKK